jgi:hypothetical protein
LGHKGFRGTKDWRTKHKGTKDWGTKAQEHMSSAEALAQEQDRRRKQKNGA